tara:strand:+ start:291 stop:800 length:510 start_codon:yes stop_codon:yes gene_type:complete
MEIFKDVKGYEGLYQVSDLGRVKSLAKLDSKGNERKEKILKPIKKSNGYSGVTLSKDNVKKQFRVHQLVAVAFCGHIIDGMNLVVNHIDFNRLNNKSNNLEVVTQRENANRKHLNSSSEYVGVGWDKASGKWMSRIVIGGKRKHLGRFMTEIEASNAYQLELNNKQTNI